MRSSYLFVRVDRFLGSLRSERYGEYAMFLTKLEDITAVKVKQHMFPFEAWYHLPIHLFFERKLLLVSENAVHNISITRGNFFNSFIGHVEQDTKE